jgi:acetyl-CoA C-acetyltransferase
MTQAFIAGAVRTPVGRRGGGLSAVHPADLGAHVVEALLTRAGVSGEEVDDVIFGCVTQAGAQSTNIARIVALSAGLPEHVPGTTIDRQCGSSQQAVHFAAQAIRCGDMDLVVAGGVEVMSKVPIGGAAKLGAEAGFGSPRGGRGWFARYGEQTITQFAGAERIAADWSITRSQMEEFAVASHARAVAAQQRGAFNGEIVPVAGLNADETPRPDTSMAAMSRLKPLSENGRLTAGVSSPISDGAAALLIASERAVERYGLTPLARVHTTAVVGSDPVRMLTGPIPATAKVLERAGLKLADIDLFEINEAFASVVIAWMNETGAPHDLTNVLGGAIALGHPLGATGARLMTTLVHQLRRQGSRYGLQAMCEGGGMANATVVEALT